MKMPALDPRSIVTLNDKAILTFSNPIQRLAAVTPLGNNACPTAGRN